MLPELDTINWNKYKYGLHPPDIPKLVRELASDDSLTRTRANSGLYEVLKSAYQRGNDLPLVLIPFFIELLNTPDLPDRAEVTDLLLVMVFLDKDGSLPEPYKTRASQIKQAVCEGRDVYRLLQGDSSIEEDIADLLRACKDMEI